MKCACGESLHLVSFREEHDYTQSSIEVKLEYMCKLGCEVKVSRMGWPGCPSIDTLLTIGRDWARNYARVTSGA